MIFEGKSGEGIPKLAPWRNFDSFGFGPYFPILFCMLEKILVWWCYACYSFFFFFDLLLPQWKGKEILRKRRSTSCTVVLFQETLVFIPVLQDGFWPGRSAARCRSGDSNGATDPYLHSILQIGFELISSEFIAELCRSLKLGLGDRWAFFATPVTSLVEGRSTLFLSANGSKGKQFIVNP